MTVVKIILKCAAACCVILLFSSVTQSACPRTKDALAASVEHLVKSDNSRDLAAVLSGYTEDIIWLPPGGEVIIGKAAIRSRYEEMFSRFIISLDSEIAETHAENLTGFVRGIYKGYAEGNRWRRYPRRERQIPGACTVRGRHMASIASHVEFQWPAAMRD